MRGRRRTELTRHERKKGGFPPTFPQRGAAVHRGVFHINGLEERWDLDPSQTHDGHSVQSSLPSVLPPPTSLHPRLPLKVSSPGEQCSQQGETPLGLAELLFPVQLVEFEEQGKLALSKPEGPAQEVEALLLPLVLRHQDKVPDATSEHIRLSVPHKYCQPADRGDREGKLEERSPHHPLCRPHVPDPGPSARDGARKSKDLRREQTSSWCGRYWLLPDGAEEQKVGDQPVLLRRDEPL